LSVVNEESNIRIARNTLVIYVRTVSYTHL